MKHHLLIVDDNEAIHEDFRKILSVDSAEAEFDAEEAEVFGSAVKISSRPEFQLSFAAQGQDALQVVQRAREKGERFSLVFMDVRMPPGWDGLETAIRLWGVDPDLQVVICTAYSDKSWEQMMERIGSPERVLILKKPFDTIEVLQLAHALTEKWSLLQAARRNTEELERTVRLRTRELEASEERFRNLSASAPIGIFETDAAGSVIYTNPVWQRITGLTLSESLGEGWIRAVHPDDLEALQQRWQATRKEARESESEFRFLLPDGETRWVQARTTPVRAESGDLSGYVGSVEDITERRRIAQKLELAHAAAVESTEVKARFLANMSHEIRTPMNGVIGMTCLLLNTPLTAEQREYAETIRASGESLLTVINDILDFTKVESGKLLFETLDFDLQEMVESTLGLLAAAAQANGVELIGFVDPGAPNALRGDAGRIRQVLTNLTGNAIKFTKTGEIVVRVTVDQENEQRAVLRFHVTDTGIGIAPKSAGKLFEAFSQADVSTTRKFGGTGLGLAISKQLVEKMDGEIGVESTPGQGSTFWFTLPLRKQANPGAVLEPNHALVNRRILIVDGNATLGQCLQTQLSIWSMRGDVAATSGEALARLRAAAGEGDPYAAAIVSLKLQDADGLALARQIQSEPGIAGVRLLLLRDFSVRLNAQELSEAGIADCRAKPVRQSTLFQCLAGILAPTPASMTTAQEQEASVVMRRRREELILIAEDNRVNQTVALGMVRNLGYSVDAVGNGAEALQALNQIAYDIVLMDCQMPEMDGYEAAMAIREREKGSSRHTWIIAMTAHAIAGDREQCLEAGMDDYLSKPVRLADLSAALERAQCHRYSTPELIAARSD